MAFGPPGGGFCVPAPGIIVTAILMAILLMKLGTFCMLGLLVWFSYRVLFMRPAEPIEKGDYKATYIMGLLVASAAWWIILKIKDWP